MARNDGIHRTSVRNMNLTAAKIGNTQRHNEREKEAYVNPDIVPERTELNVHFKQPSGGYAEMFAQMEADGIISTRGLKDGANLYGELIFDVNSTYFCCESRTVSSRMISSMQCVLLATPMWSEGSVAVPRNI